SEEHTSELQSLTNLVCRLLLEKKKKQNGSYTTANLINPSPSIEPSRAACEAVAPNRTTMPSYATSMDSSSLSLRPERATTSHVAELLRAAHTGLASALFIVTQSHC